MIKNVKKNNKPKPMLWGKDLLKDFTAREAKLLKDRFGIDQENSLNLDEVGKKFDISRERIGKIEEKAMRKLRNRGDDDIEPA